MSFSESPNPVAGRLLGLRRQSEEQHHVGKLSAHGGLFPRHRIQPNGGSCRPYTWGKYSFRRRWKASARTSLPEKVYVLSKGKPNPKKIHRRQKPNRAENVGKRYQSYQRFSDGSQNQKLTTKIKAIGNRGPVWCYAPQCPNCGEWSGLEYTTNPRFDELSSVRESYNIGPRPEWVKEHPARMNPALVRDLILAYSEWGDIVLDPVAGTGTTLEQAYQNQRYYLGMEKAERYYEMCRRRVYEAEREVMERLAAM